MNATANLRFKYLFATPIFLALVVGDYIAVAYLQRTNPLPLPLVEEAEVNPPPASLSSSLPSARPLQTPVQTVPRNLSVGQPDPVVRRFDGSSTLYKIPQLKQLAEKNLNNAWLYGSFVYRRHSGNVVTAVTGAKLLLVKEGFTEVNIECVWGFRLRPETVQFYRTQLGQPPAPPFDIQKTKPIELIEVRRTNGRLRVYAKYYGSLTL